jgi:uncharacterized integral membrane protein (TIGR00698 family)
MKFNANVRPTTEADMKKIQFAKDVLPGILLCAAIAAISYGAEWLEVHLTGQRFIDALVFAILLGTAYHSIAGLHPRFHRGIHFSAKTLLELAIVFLGASLSLSVITGMGGLLVAVVAGVVVVAIVVSYAIGRSLGLHRQLALLVACGNSICGNSAIVAAAPVIEAESDDVAASIAFTAALGIAVVLLLPLGARIFDIGQHSYGILAGMTVYAVPQVLAATVPVGAISVQLGTVVKLMRVLMLGPVILVLGLSSGTRTTGSLKIRHLVPWFIVGFFAMMLLRTANLLPQWTVAPMQEVATLLTILSMAALGLAVDIRSVFASGGRVLAAGCLSILALTAISGSLIYFLAL